MYVNIGTHEYAREPGTDKNEKSKFPNAEKITFYVNLNVEANMNIKFGGNSFWKLRR
jgi:hypothetical protein